jgi:hypothetical protein
MRALWIDSGNDPDWAKCQAYAITHPFFDMFDPRVTHDYLADVVGRGYGVGVYMAWNWPQFANQSGKQVAETVHERVREIAGANPRKDFPKVQFDIEAHDPPYILACLKRWRELRRYQDTSWTMEYHQGGWMSRPFVDAIVGLRIRVVPQAYGGTDGRMDYGVCPLAAARDLTRRGFPDAQVSPFYDAALLRSYIDWNGWAFTMGRLP